MLLVLKLGTLHISTHTYVNSQRNKFSPVSSIIQMGQGLQTFIFFESLMDVQVRVSASVYAFFYPLRRKVEQPSKGLASKKPNPPLPTIPGLDSTASDCLHCHHHSKKNPGIVSSAPGCTNVSPQLFGSLCIPGSLHCSRSRVPLQRYSIEYAFLLRVSLNSF